MFRELAALLPYLKKYRRRYAAGFVLLVITSGGQMVIPQILKAAVDTIAGGAFAAEDVLDLVGILLAVAFAISLARFGWRYFIHGTSRRIEAELRERLFDHLMDLHAGFFAGRKTGDFMARMTNDMHAVRMASGMAVVALTDGIFMTLAILAILFRQSPELTGYIVLPLPVITGLIIFLGSFVGKKFKKVQETFAALSGAAQESISGIRVVKSFVKEDFFLRKFGEDNDAYRRANMELVRLWGLFHPAVAFLSGLTGVLLLYFGGKEVLEGRLTPGGFVAFFSYLEMLIWPMIGAGFTVNLLQRGAAALGRINEILSVQPEISSPPGALMRVPRGGLEVRDLTFSYGNGSAVVLRDASFSAAPGTSLGILGRTGSGKSTLVSLLPRLYDPPRGTVFIDGEDILHYDLHHLRRAFGVVPQDTFLFSATIRENIAFGADGPLDDREIADLAEISTIARDAEGFPGGYDTEIGERGLTLSGGQKQRVAISRALARDPEILILDDALSAVDTDTEEKILSRVLARRGGKTNIIISHRIRALSRCDLIIVLDGGRVVQRGTHRDLLNEPGLYREIHELQTAESAVLGEEKA
jgi:ATP-binding cassette subfamily B protein